MAYIIWLLIILTIEHWLTGSPGVTIVNVILGLFVYYTGKGAAQLEAQSAVTGMLRALDESDSIICSQDRTIEAQHGYISDCKAELDALKQELDSLQKRCKFYEQYVPARTKFVGTFTTKNHKKVTALHEVLTPQETAERFA